MFKTYTLGETTVNALDGVSFGVDYGEFVAIMGHSGSGKSTMLNILGALDTPTSGSYMLDGREDSTMYRNELATCRNQKLGFGYQNGNRLPRTSAVEQVELPAFYGGCKLSAKERRARAIELLTMVGLGKRLYHTPAQMSGGQQQRVAIARALMNNPPLILADEPTGNLDTKSSIEIVTFLQELNSKGITIVMVTHEDDIASYAKRRIVMKDGKIDREDDPRKGVPALRA
ncbi:MAG: ABC transporter ATP-binding protein [Lentisphaeria bacterium]|nr:ABC transporter ATP-binding protein [Lentisphaeria bacterium]